MHVNITQTETVLPVKYKSKYFEKEYASVLALSIFNFDSNSLDYQFTYI